MKPSFKRSTPSLPNYSAHRRHGGLDLENAKGQFPPMPTFNLKAAAKQLPSLVARAEAGEEILIARGTKLVARLVPTAKAKRQFGSLKGLVNVGPEFFDPLPEDELKL